MTGAVIVEAIRRLEHFEKEEIRRRQQWEARFAALDRLRTPLMVAGGVLAVGLGACIAYRWMRR